MVTSFPRNKLIKFFIW